MYQKSYCSLPDIIVSVGIDISLNNMLKFCVLVLVLSGELSCTQTGVLSVLKFDRLQLRVCLLLQEPYLVPYRIASHNVLLCSVTHALVQCPNKLDNPSSINRKLNSCGNNSNRDCFYRDDSFKINNRTLQRRDSLR